jgi:hypothetical protein
MTFYQAIPEGKARIIVAIDQILSIVAFGMTDIGRYPRKQSSRPA